ncbi:MAG: prenyltransferase [Peptococcaceae bacterium]|nr:prenyltransferase [Peptococcaceae bacterium]
MPYEPLYKPLTAKSLKELAAPQTWPAGILPILLAAALSYTVYQTFSLFSFALLLVLSILLQSAVNTLNDYFDFVKGTDREDNFFDKKDASIIYNHMNPKTAFKVGMVFLGLALIGGLYLVFQAGWPLLVFGFLGAATVYFYSGGPYPISYLPLGEAVSGVMMGGLLPMAALYVFNGAQALSWATLYDCLPLILSIGLILFTNNTCDIARDTEAGRHTLPILLGHKVSAKIWFFGFLLEVALIAHISFYSFRPGFWLIFPLLICYGFYLKRLWRMEFTPGNRRQAMQTTLLLTTVVNGCYILIILWAGVFSG